MRQAGQSLRHQVMLLRNADRTQDEDGPPFFDYSKISKVNIHENAVFWLSSSERQINKFLSHAPPIWSCRYRTSSSPIYCSAVCKYWKKNILEAFRRAPKTVLCPEMKASESLFPPLYTPWAKVDKNLISDSHFPTQRRLFFSQIFSLRGEGKGKVNAPLSKNPRKKEINSLLFCPFSKALSKELTQFVPYFNAFSRLVLSLFFVKMYVYFLSPFWRWHKN